MMTARDLAKDFLRPYVERGDSLDSITEGHMGCFSREYCLQIGACVWKNGKARDYSRDELVVTRFRGKECLLVFSVPDLIEEIKKGAAQPSLWESLL